MLRSLIVAFVVPCSVFAQDMVGVDFFGDLYAIDSFTGAAATIGFGVVGQNCLARDGNGTLWSSGRISNGLTTNHFISRIDPVQGSAHLMFPAHDIRGLATGSGSTLYASVHEGGPSALYRYDTASGVATRIGPSRANEIQGLTAHQGLLYAWDLSLGLGIVDTATGVFTDVNPAVGGRNIQWLAERGDGQLIGGGLELFTIDTATGVATAYASTTPVRGAERSSFAAGFGTGCDGGTGIVTLRASGMLVPGTAVTTTSIGHTDFGPIFSQVGIAVLGFSRSSTQGLPLPALLDPILGTVGCSLHVSVDGFDVVPTIASGVVAMQHTVLLPPILHDYTFFVQHLALDRVPGGLSASNGLMLHVTN